MQDAQLHSPPQRLQSFWSAPGIVDFWFSRQPEVSIPDADRKDQGLWR